MKTEFMQMTANLAHMSEEGYGFKSQEGSLKNASWMDTIKDFFNKLILGNKVDYTKLDAAAKKFYETAINELSSNKVLSKMTDDDRREFIKDFEIIDKKLHEILPADHVFPDEVENIRSAAQKVSQYVDHSGPKIIEKAKREVETGNRAHQHKVEEERRKKAEGLS